MKQNEKYLIEMHLWKRRGRTIDLDKRDYGKCYKDEAFEKSY